MQLIKYILIFWLVFSASCENIIKRTDFSFRPKDFVKCLDKKNGQNEEEMKKLILKFRELKFPEIVEMTKDLFKVTKRFVTECYESAESKYEEEFTVSEFIKFLRIGNRSAKLIADRIISMGIEEYLVKECK